MIRMGTVTGIDKSLPGKPAFFVVAREIILLILLNKATTMFIERTSDEVIIRLPASVDTTGLQRLVDYLVYKEVTANSKAKQEQVDKLSAEVKKGWWKKNRKRFIK